MFYQQYKECKKKNHSAVILFRTGDFYTSYESDAKACSEVLGITLTKSVTIKNDYGMYISLTRFPYHALDIYLPKLIRAGLRVAICDKIETQKTYKARQQ